MQKRNQSAQSVANLALILIADFGQSLAVAQMEKFAQENGVDLRPLEEPSGEDPADLARVKQLIVRADAGEFLSVDLADALAAQCGTNEQVLQIEAVPAAE